MVLVIMIKRRQFIFLLKTQIRKDIMRAKRVILI